ncbi:MAG: polysaccharide deacetylase family protein [Pseudorhodoplanes sp.]|uniref:polysaccharide deacetylase family protein n=1 Tax=Pseudorhodoplanes sp. TaxID=1934341 RepID=UPI003D0E777C
MHGGLDALVSALKRRNVRATFAVPAVLALLYSEKIRRLQNEGHEIAAHGFKHEDVSLLEPEEESCRLKKRGILPPKKDDRNSAGNHRCSALGDGSPCRTRGTNSPAEASAATPCRSC